MAERYARSGKVRKRYSRLEVEVRLDACQTSLSEDSLGAPLIAELSRVIQSTGCRYLPYQRLPPPYLSSHTHETISESLKGTGADVALPVPCSPDRLQWSMSPGERWPREADPKKLSRRCGRGTRPPAPAIRYQTCRLRRGTRTALLRLALHDTHDQPSPNSNRSSLWPLLHLLPGLPLT